MKVTLSRHAKADLEDIRNYTIENWGSHKWLLYYRRLSHAFEQINKHDCYWQRQKLVVARHALPELSTSRYFFQAFRCR